MTPEEITSFEDRLSASLITPEAYPALHRAVEAGVFRSEGDPFGSGLDRILDGIEACIGVLRDGGAHAAPAPWIEDEAADVADDKRYRAARKALREAEKALRAARTLERQALAEARARRRSG
jgi:hypothetical protein